MSYQDVLSQAVVKGLGVTIGVMLGLVTVTPVLKYFYTESPRKTVEQKKDSKSSTTNRQSHSVFEVPNEYSALFDDLQN